MTWIGSGLAQHFFTITCRSLEHHNKPNYTRVSLTRLILLLQVLLTAMLVSALCKKLDDGHDDIDDDEKEPELQPDEEWVHVPRK